MTARRNFFYAITVDSILTEQVGENFSLTCELSARLSLYGIKLMSEGNVETVTELELTK